MYNLETWVICQDNKKRRYNRIRGEQNDRIRGEEGNIIEGEDNKRKY